MKMLRRLLCFLGVHSDIWAPLLGCTWCGWSWSGESKP